MASSAPFSGKRPARSPPTQATEATKRSKPSSPSEKLHWSQRDVQIEPLFYADLPSQLQEDGLASNDVDGRNRIQAVLGEVLDVSEQMRTEAEERLRIGRYMLEAPKRENDNREELLSKRQARSRLRNAKFMSNRQKKKAGLLNVDVKELKYDTFLRLHKLWKQYLHGLTNGSVNSQVLQSKLLKADLQGAHISVVRSRCPSLIGKSGIVIRETQHTFQIISKDDSVRRLPKQHSVFGLHVQNNSIEMFGDQIRFRPSERASRKFKPLHSIEL